MFGGALGNMFWGLSMLLHMIIPIMLIILTVILGIEIRDRIKKKEGSNGGPVSALKDRYARGEISREEFLKTKEELTQA